MSELATQTKTARRTSQSVAAGSTDWEVRRTHARVSHRFGLRRFTPWLGVDAGTHAVKLAVVEPAGDEGWTLAHTQRVLWPATSDPFASPDQFGQALGQLLHETKADWSQYGVRSAAFSLPAFAVSEQELADDADADDTMRKIYQASPDSLAFDCWSTLAEDNGLESGQAATLVWADPDVVGSALGAFRKSGLMADVLDTSALATARAAQLTTSAELPGSELVVDWGAGGITLTWLLDGQPQFTRTSIHGGCLEVVDAVARTFELGVPEAELLLSKYGLPDADACHLSLEVEACLAEPLAILTHEIERTISFLASRYPRHGVERCLMIGGGAAIRNVSAWVASQTERPTRVWSLGAAVAEVVRLQTSEVSRLQLQTLNPTPLFAQAAALSALAPRS